ncbi:MAG: hypothetical protein KDC26_07185 [Armatimonadetes bacterium]|nr:hypothetical protein [Armatimonadota bacterium]
MRVLTFGITLSLAMSALAGHDLLSRAESIDSALKKWSAATGTEYTATGYLKNEPLIANVTDMEEDRFRDLLAKVTGGTWSNSGSGWALAPNKANTNTFRQEKLNDYASRIAANIKENLAKTNSDDWSEAGIRQKVEAQRKQIQDLADQLNMPGAAGDVEVFMGGAGGASTAQPLLQEFLRRISPNRLAQIEAGQRVVFSSQPTRLQSAFGFDMSAALGLTNARINQVAKIAASYTPLEAKVRIGGALDLSGVAKPVSHFLVSVYRFPGGEGFSVSVTGYDRSGKNVAQAAGSIIPKRREIKSLWEESNFEISPLSAEIIKSLRYGQSTDGGREVNEMAFRMRVEDEDINVRLGSPAQLPLVSEVAQRALAQPAQIEPLSTFVSETLIAAARVSKKDLVAIPTDDLFTNLGQLINQAQPSTEVLKEACEKADVVAVEDGNALLFRAMDTEREANSRVSRSWLQTQMQVAQSGYLRLVNRIQFAEQMAREGKSGMSFEFLRMFAPTEASGLLQIPPAHRDLLRLYGHANVNLDQMPEGKASRAMNQMTSADQQILWQMLLNRPSGPMIMGEGMAISMTTGGPGEQNQPKLTDYQRESTVFYANASLQTIGVEFQQNAKQLLYARLGNSKGGEFMSPKAIGVAQGMSSQMANQNINLPVYDRFQLAEGRTINIKLITPQGQGDETDQVDAWVVPGTALMAANQLPPAITAAIAAGQEAAKRMQFGTLGGGGNVPPPVR